MWTELYDSFIEKSNFPPRVAMADCDREVIAHNMACNAVWIIQKLEREGLLSVKR